jgi:iron complex outermembrane receptor protein
MHRKEEFWPSEFGLYNTPTPYPAAPAPDLTLLDYEKTVKNSYAAYLELNYDITDKLTITAAGRYSIERVLAFHRQYFAYPASPMVYPDPRGQFTFRKFTPRAVIRYKPNENHTFYASYSQGFKSGFVDAVLVGSCPGGPGDPSCLPTPVKPETVDAFEIGYKGRFAGGRVNVSLAAFHYNYKNIQVFIYQPPTGFYQNAASGRLNGFDFDLSVDATRDLTLTVGGTYVDSKYTDFKSASVFRLNTPAECAASFLPYPCGNTQFNANVTGNQLQNAPKFTATAAIDFHHDFPRGRLGINVNGNYNSGFPFDVNGHIRQHRYALLNAEVSVSPAALPGVRIVAWGKNLTDHDYLQSTLPTAYADLVSWALPRTYGVRAEYRF